jgi:hypothetical protein
MRRSLSRTCQTRPDAELEDLLPPLVVAGYIAIDRESPAGHFWRFTPEGVQHVDALGLDAAEE